MLPETPEAAERRRINDERTAIAREKARLILETSTEVVSDSPLTTESWPPAAQWTDKEAPKSDRQKYVSFEVDSPAMIKEMMPFVKPEPNLDPVPESSSPEVISPTVAVAASTPEPLIETPKIEEDLVEITPLNLKTPKEERLLH